jgi:hypothetical protein
MVANLLLPYQFLGGFEVVFITANGSYADYSVTYRLNSISNATSRRTIRL